MGFLIDQNALFRFVSSDVLYIFVESIDFISFTKYMISWCFDEMENFERKINHNFCFNDETKQIFYLLSLITILSFQIILSQKQKLLLKNLWQNVKLNCIHYIKRFKLK